MALICIKTQQINGCVDVFLQHVPQESLVMTAEMNVETVNKSMLVTMLMVIVPMVAMKDLKDSSVKHVRVLCIKVYIGFLRYKELLEVLINFIKFLSL